MKLNSFIAILISICFITCTNNKEVINTPTTPAVTQFFTDRITLSNQPRKGTAFNGTVNIPYSGGNGLVYQAGAPINSTGVSGLSATLQGGTLNNGDGSLSLNLAGTPADSGSANFSFNIFGISGTFKVMVLNTTTALVLVDSLYGDSVNYNDTPNASLGYNAMLLLPYKNGNGVMFAQTTPVNSTGVSGLTAIIQSGTLNNGNGRLNVVISGTPTSAGRASFLLSFGGRTTVLNLQVTYKYTYTNSISVIFNQSCALPGCHNSTSMAAGKSFGSYQSSILVSSTSIIGSINGATGYSLMPRGGPKLPDSTITKITYWANNNKPQ
ncbi:MAG: hypothetical protein ORN85_00175 [Sediminibacterium sp.]|nr:hypothetical protein [Sediminibacterium sp.]